MNPTRRTSVPDSWVDDAPATYDLRLYVSGATPASARAVVNTRRLCETHLRDRYTLEIINIADDVERAARDQIVAAPTLIKGSPPPVRRFIGDMSDVDRILAGLIPDRAS